MCTVKIGRFGEFDPNPRGELWLKDENRFGHKLLSKFGWSRGKGLGKNEDGIPENLKVRKKLGNTGVGWDEKSAVGIDFRKYDAMLEDLSKRYQKSGEVKNEVVSLEKRSQEFKNRIHYQKFIRGKDTSQYSDKDMSCIFLSKEPEKEMESTAKESAVTNVESRPADHSAKESVPTFNSQLSMADYFAMKMKNKIGSSLSAPKESKTCEESSQSETDAKSRKRKLELKSSKKAKRMKREPELSTAGGSLSYEEENTSESSSSSQEAAEEVLVSKEQFQKVEECESVRKLSKKARKLLNAFKSKQDIENNQQEENVVEKNSTEDESLEDQSQEGSSNSTEESNSMTEKELTSRKRKKEHKSCKKAKKRRLEEAEISTSVEKNSSHSESDDEKFFSEECTTKSVKTEKRSLKESKKHKNKIFNLKSCLKSLSNNKYSFKEKRKVSFCETISYKVIENVLNNFDSDVVLETNEQLLSCSDEDCTDSEVPNEIENIGMNHVDDSNSSGKSSNGDVQCGGEDVPCQEDSDVAEDNTVPECFKLPKCSSTNYDGWLETQRVAARMKVYKNMVKKMKKHPILRKTNLLEIKGYGNWGL
ncbi:PIN2/TERF1-interacting telomerase inhibitor 1 [Araneus ventricosus]|uniref:PIN2/TERF1-interacting telomerase inhibitor 1 n=1 Tax=Araneus ventricosus TaxID=182803 RepID=A0A4Y2JHC8_ARAVE|nr:PIN2/TERF1-interacting telomerase inhibitor 1 [Araneus ventricosus]